MKSRYISALFILGLFIAGCHDESTFTIGNNSSNAGGDKSHEDATPDSKKDPPSKDEQTGDSEQSPDQNQSEDSNQGADDQNNAGQNGAQNNDNGQNGDAGDDGQQTDPSLDPSIPRDVAGGLASWLEELPCELSFGMCDSNYFLECRDNHYYIQENCNDNPDRNLCLDSVGCARCMPETTFCEDNQVFTCNGDGSQKILQRTCSDHCSDGMCLDEDNCNEDAKFIYLVDPTYNLIKFNPGDKTGTYETLLFELNCYSESTPFSMAVDRNAVAWVLYYDASIYKVDIATQKCTFVKKLQANQLGGMGFCSDEPGSSKETLYMAERGSGHFAKINPDTLEYTELAPFPEHYEHSPELTGTGLANLIAFSPGTGNQYISEIDKNTGSVLVEYKLPGVPMSSYAVAHWGGYYFAFLGNRIYRFDPKTQEFITFLSNAPYNVIGAGVSTCAPVQAIN